MTQRIGTGFDPSGVFTGRVLLPPAKYKDAASLCRDGDSRLAGRGLK